MKRDYDYITSNYEYALRNTTNGVDVYDKGNGRFIVSLTNVTSISDFEDEDGNIEEEKVFDAIKEEEEWKDYQDNMAVYGSPT